VRSSSVRAIVALALSSALLILSGCGVRKSTASSTASPGASRSATASATPSAKPVKAAASTNLDKITVTGAYGKSPKVTLKAPWAIDKTRVKVLKASNGPTVKAGQSVEVNYYGMIGRTGKRFDDSYSTGRPAAFNLDQVVPGFKKGLIGQRQGSRVIVAMPGKDGYDAAGGNSQIGVEVGDTLLFVIDIVTVQLSGPQGAAIAPKPGLPTVADKGGKPQITVPKTAPPATLQVEPLIKGTGKKVAAADTVTFNYRWVAWKDGRLLEDNYSGKPATAALSTLLLGLQKGLVNQAVGSRVMVVVPPADGYPNGNPKPKIAPGETLVLVVDLLFTQGQ
jgi:peptidylprolyl isomerase